MHNVEAKPKVVVRTAPDFVNVPVSDVNDGDVVCLLGWHAEDDAGKGMFHYDANSTAPVVQ